MRSSQATLAAVALATVLALVAACGDGQSGGAVGESEPAGTSGQPTSAQPTGTSGQPTDASGRPTGGSSTPPLSSVPPPTISPPTGPPTAPSDPKPTDWIAGRITRGGSGPCYGLETDDGVQYAMYSTDGITLQVGAIVRARVEPLRLFIYCGPGQHVHMLKVEIVG
ncbi:MAG TPA: hypothetical protein VKG85_05900 [Actinomycetes bacterium]|nr:hypothetical protein [Actinomycetes bacterium]